MIKVRYTSVDSYGASASRKFQTIEGARRFAHKWVGETPEMGSRYAISGDGVGKITVEGATLAELFPATAPKVPAQDYRIVGRVDQEGDEFYEVWWGVRRLGVHETRHEAEGHIYSARIYDQDHVNGGEG